MNKKLLFYVRCALCCALTAVFAQITVPAPVPFTMQTFALFLTYGVFGGGVCAVSVALYIFCGLFGAPFFSGFSGGFAPFLGSGGGFIIGFFLAALFMLALEKVARSSFFGLFAVMLSGLFICYCAGVIWYLVFYGTGSGIISALTVCILPFVIPDIIKLTLAFCLSKKLRKALRVI